MSVHVVLSTTLRACVPEYNPRLGLNINWSAPLTIMELASQLGLPLADIKIVMLNGRRVDLNHMVQDNDRVGFFPAVGGG